MSVKISGEQEARTTARSAGAIAVSRLWGQAMQITAFLLAARFLGPHDFGIFAIVQAVALGLTIVAVAGWREQAIVRPSLSSPAFFLALVAAGLVSAILGLMALVTIAFGLHPAMAPLFVLFAISVPLLSAATFLEGIALREGRVHRYAMGAIVAESVYLGVTALLLWTDHGVLSLGLARVVLSAIYLGGALAATRPPMPRPGSRRIRKKILGFVRGIVAARFSDYMSNNGATILVGAALGPAATGLYRAATRLVAAAFEAVSEVSRTLSWRAAGSSSACVEAVRAKALLSAIWSVAFPACVGLALVGSDLVAVALGPEWAATASLIGILAVRRLALSAYGAAEASLARRGETGLAGRLAFQVAGLTLLFILAGIPFGLVATATAHLAAGLVGGILILRSFHLTAGLGYGDMARAAARPAIATSG
jgi:O-antigen/teichoic acid export membrane protein